MRGFTQTLVNTLFGWIRILVEGIWDLLFSNETQKWVQWVADNWMTLVVFLCFCGVVIDYLVWFLRWRPYYVWASSIRRMRRFFGGGKDREEKQISREPKRQRPMQVPVREPAPEELPYEAGNDADTGWEEQNWDQTAAWQPEPGFDKVPSVTADTIMARPRKADFKEQYVRRFARPEPEPQPAAVWQEDPSEEWIEPQQVYLPEQEAYKEEEENWAPEPFAPSPDGPIHPGIDYQALSRQYGWHREVQNTDTQTPEEEDIAQEEQPREQLETAWNFSGLENFSPYRVPVPPAEREQRTERARKTRADSTPLSRVKSSLSRIAKHAGKVLTVDDEEANKILDGLPPPIDKRRAFHAPVYPNRPGTDTKKSPDFREDD